MLALVVSEVHFVFYIYVHLQYRILVKLNEIIFFKIIFKYPAHYNTSIFSKTPKSNKASEFISFFIQLKTIEIPAT